jgi:TrmH family RNA methyltransferase
VSDGPQLIETARADPDLVVLEGFHALKHALRFGAQVTHVLAADVESLVGLATDLAPDLVDAFASRTVETTEVASPTGRPLILLEDPRQLGNVGAAVRVAAAADIAGLVTTGRADPWDPAALRGSAGLHFALPVGRIQTLVTQRPVLGLTPDGEPLRPAELPSDAVLAFGTERAGLSEELRHRCDARLALPMRAGVSSLNLATAVAAVLFAWRLAEGWGGR